MPAMLLEDRIDIIENRINGLETAAGKLPDDYFFTFNSAPTQEMYALHAEMMGKIVALHEDLAAYRQQFIGLGVQVSAGGGKD